MPKAPRRSTRLAAAAWIAFAAALIAPGPARAQVRTDVEEKVKARLYIVRLQLGTNPGAKARECRNLESDDLRVLIRPGEVPPLSVKPRRRKSVVRGSDSIHLDRRVQPKVHALVMDTSASMTGDIAHARRAAAEYVSQLDLTHEKVLIATFDESVSLWQGVTHSLDRLLLAIDDVRLGGQTAMLDGLVYTMRELDAHPERPVLVLLSDGRDTASFHRPEEVIEQATSRPDLTVFTVGIGLRMAQAGSDTRMFLKELAASTNGRFFDIDGVEGLEDVFGKIRDILGTEAILTVVDPQPESDPGRLLVQPLKSGCLARVIETDRDHLDHPPIPRPYSNPPHTYEAGLTDAHRTLYARAAERDEVPCEIPEATYRETGRTGWQLRASDSGIEGCGPDVTVEPGLLFDPSRPSLTVNNDHVAVTTRPFAMPVPELAGLPSRPEELLDRLATLALERGAVPLSEEHARPFFDHPQLAHGTTFLEIRPMLARALFLYPEYRGFALAKLQEEGRRRLGVLEDLYRRQFPELPDDVVVRAARDSHDGRQIVERAGTPSEVDLQPFLAAWLGDITAHDLFLRWERERIDRLIQGRESPLPDEQLDAGWRALRSMLLAPSFARVLTLLAPVRDPDCDCIGYWRVMLPRPSLLRPRMREESTIPLDLVADRPLAYWTIRRMLDRSPELLARLREDGFRATSLTYELLGDFTEHGPGRAFGKSRLALSLEAPGVEGEEAPRMTLVADVSLTEPEPIPPVARVAEPGRAAPPRPAGPGPGAQPRGLTVDEAFARLGRPRNEGPRSPRQAPEATDSSAGLPEPAAEATPEPVARGPRAASLDALRLSASGDATLQRLLRKARRAVLARGAGS
jgi:Mg-chelatase subunit ChlD